MSEIVRPDEFFILNIEGSASAGHEFRVNAKYDRLDYIQPLGHWLLKVYDDELGLVTMHIDGATAMQVRDYANLPICLRDSILQSEYEGYLQAAAKMVDDSWLADPPDEPPRMYS